MIVSYPCLVFSQLLFLPGLAQLSGAAGLSGGGAKQLPGSTAWVGGLYWRLVGGAAYGATPVSECLGIFSCASHHQRDLSQPPGWRAKARQ